MECAERSEEIHMDLEKASETDDDLTNHGIASFAWQNVNLELHSRANDHGTRKILDSINGHVAAGELLAIMGPSGSGKTTLLNVLAGRSYDFKRQANAPGIITINNHTATPSQVHAVSSFVEQEDTLIGALTVRETLDIAARLSLPKSVSTADRSRRVDELLQAFGLQQQANVMVGTPIRKGISGGQKRRLSIASQLITAPKILFLDEPTSGLDSTASFEVIRYLRSMARRHSLIIIASIHQPSSSTFNLFDSLLLLSEGQTCYCGHVQHMRTYMDAHGHPIPVNVNPAEHLLEMTNLDFQIESTSARLTVQDLTSSWLSSTEASGLLSTISQSPSSSAHENPPPRQTVQSRGSFPSVLLALLHRSFIKSYRDVVAYGIRFAMYMGLAIMMGTVWLRLPPTQSSIQPFINALFFGGAFISFMAVAYVPSYLEDRSTFIKERANGLYGATAFLLSNIIIGVPYLFCIALMFSIPTYYLVNFRPGDAAAFWTYTLWLFLDLLAAESLVVLIASLFPNFVIALALTAFANGLWMSVGGFLVSPEVLNVFWRYVFHYIDYQAYVFRAMMANEFAKRTYSCGEGCHCMYASDLARDCRIDGRAVLHEYGYRENGNGGKWVGIMLAIIIVYRLLAWIVLAIKRT